MPGRGPAAGGAACCGRQHGAFLPGMNVLSSPRVTFELQPQQFLDRFCWFRTQQEKWAPGPGAQQGFSPSKENVNQCGRCRGEEVWGPAVSICVPYPPSAVGSGAG